MPVPLSRDSFQTSRGIEISWVKEAKVNKAELVEEVINFMDARIDG